MTAEVFGRVLPLPERVVCRWLQDPRTALSGVLMVSIHVLDPHVHVLAHLVRTRRTELGAVRRVESLAHTSSTQHDCAFTNVKLAVAVPCSQTLRESEGVTLLACLPGLAGAGTNTTACTGALAPGTYQKVVVPAGAACFSDGPVTIRGGLFIGFWFGFIRNHVNGAVNLNNNVLLDPDGNEYVTNVIHGSLKCAGNSPAPQIGDSEGSANQVTGTKQGQCANV